MARRREQRRREPLRGQGRLAAFSVLPLLLAGGYHLVMGGNTILLLVVSAAVVCFVLMLDVGRRRWYVAVRQRNALGGRHVWRASITTESLNGLSTLPRAVIFLRDLVPVTVEINPSALVMSPPRRYARIGVAKQRIALMDIRRSVRQELGHVRPDGSLSTNSVVGVTVTLKRGDSFDLVFDVGGVDFLGALRRASAGAVN